MEQKYIDLFDEFTHTDMGRRTFMERLTKLAGSVAAAMAVLPVLENNYTDAETIKQNDARLDTGMIEYTGGKDKVSAYKAFLKGKEKLPGVLVIHENRGLNPHIKDVARRVALEGFFALAPDALSEMGGTPDDEDKAREMIGKLDHSETLQNYLKAFEYLEHDPQCTGKVGCVGFCWGGSMANQLAVNSPGLLAAVAYYGGQPKNEDVPKIKAKLLLHYAGLDERINKGIPDFRKALDEAKINYELYIYDGVNHAFNNDTNSARYNADAAKLAWGRTIKFLKENLE
jgi:carboxymethylenebutenolidase